MLHPPAFTISQLKDNIRKSILNIEAYKLLLEDWAANDIDHVPHFDLNHVRRQLNKNLSYLANVVRTVEGSWWVEERLVWALDDLERLSRRCPQLERYTPSRSSIGF